VQNSGLQYLSASTDALETRSPNQQLFPLTAKVNSQDHLEIGGCDVTALVEQFGTPLYIVDETTLRTACQQYRDAFKRYYPGESLVLYASKAWNCLAICAIVAAEGNNKSLEEIQLAIENGCTVVADNWLDLHTLAKLSQGSIVDHPIRMMIRFTPGIECHTHEYIRTGHLDSKFGFDPGQLDEVFKFISQQPGLSCVGIHAHIGSQIFELQPHNDLGSVIIDTLMKANQQGLNISEVNIGGGLGICYTESDDPPSIDDWVKIVTESVIKACEQKQYPLPKLLSEPGRSMIGSSCVTAYTVGSQKQVPGIRTYIAVDGGMSDNPRPITYQSLYRVVLANKMSAPMTETVTVAGKHCESGDILVVMATGAYNYSMASNYNRLSKPAAVLVSNGDANVIIERESYQDLISKDRLPERLTINS
jgi:diaminopimelate decarboxylase